MKLGEVIPKYKEQYQTESVPDGKDTGCLFGKDTGTGKDAYCGTKIVFDVTYQVWNAGGHRAFPLCISQQKNCGSRIGDH